MLVASGGGRGCRDAETEPITMRAFLGFLRAVVGLTFVAEGTLVLAHVQAATVSFVAWNVPDVPVSVWFIGAVAVVCGLMLAVGALTRPVALLLATLAVGAAMTAGRHGVTTVAFAAPLLFLGCVFFAWRSDRVTVTGPSRPPGVQ